jgi:hypothetical protein
VTEDRLHDPETEAINESTMVAVDLLLHPLERTGLPSVPTLLRHSVP